MCVLVDATTERGCISRLSPDQPARLRTPSYLLGSTSAHHPPHFDLLLLPQVLITPHTAFLTSEALDNIARTTISNIEEFLQDKQLTNELHPKPMKK